MSRLQKKAKKPNHIISGQDLQKKVKFEGFGFKKAKLVTLAIVRVYYRGNKIKFVVCKFRFFSV